MDLLRVMERVLWLDQGRFVHSFVYSFIKVFTQH